MYKSVDWYRSPDTSATPVSLGHEMITNIRVNDHFKKTHAKHKPMMPISISIEDAVVDKYSIVKSKRSPG